MTLLSDGATRLVDLFELATWQEALDILGESGPDELIRRARQAEAGDPDGRRWPRGKAQDEATALHWVLPHQPALPLLSPLLRCGRPPLVRHGRGRTESGR